MSGSVLDACWMFERCRCSACVLHIHMLYITFFGINLTFFSSLLVCNFGCRGAEVFGFVRQCHSAEYQRDLAMCPWAEHQRLHGQN